MGLKAKFIFAAFLLKSKSMHFKKKKSWKMCIVKKLCKDLKNVLPTNKIILTYSFHELLEIASLSETALESKWKSINYNLRIIVLKVNFSLNEKLIT